MAKQQKKANPPSKKPVAARKTVVSAKKSSPGSSKSLAKKPVEKKDVSKKPPSKKAGPKKQDIKKPVLKKTGTSKKQAPKKQVPAKKIVKPIIKSAPDKKTAKPVVKKAAPKNLATTKKTIAAKSGTEVNKPKTIPTKQVTVQSPVKNKKPVKKIKASAINEHNEDLKKAVTKNREAIKKPQKPFVMPKVNTEKSRKYEPQFIKSVLDHAPEENNGPSMRYSDNELTEFRELITRKLETAKKELGYLQGLITRKDEMGGDDTDNRYMTMEDGSLSMEREQLSQMASRQITFIDHLEKAMMRIENKTYGICRVTGKLIDKARLRAVPHATLSIEAKMGISR